MPWAGAWGWWLSWGCIYWQKDRPHRPPRPARARTEEDSRLVPGPVDTGCPRKLLIPKLKSFQPAGETLEFGKTFDTRKRKANLCSGLAATIQHNLPCPRNPVHSWHVASRRRQHWGVSRKPGREEILRDLQGLIVAFPGQPEKQQRRFSAGVGQEEPQVQLPPGPEGRAQRVSPPVCVYCPRHQGSLLNFGPTQTQAAGKAPSWLF